MDKKTILVASDISKTFHDAGDVTILKDVNFEISSGDLVSICGKSGSGKSTLLFILSSLLKPDTGKVLFNGYDIYRMTDNQKMHLRQKSFGFVFQDNLLLEDLSARENILLPMQIAGDTSQKSKDRILDLAQLVGVAGILNKKVCFLSSGEKSRISLLRAVAIEKDVIFLDEPTGTLDNENAKNIEKLIVDFASNLNIAFVYVTHDEKFACNAKRQFMISCKKLIDKSQLQSEL